jgi:hypothetical protein
LSQQRVDTDRQSQIGIAVEQDQLRGLLHLTQRLRECFRIDQRGVCDIA